MAGIGSAAIAEQLWWPRPGELTYAAGSVDEGVSIVEVRDGKVARQIDYFAQPFEAPQWRSRWVRRMPR
jgi:hypothetical protein